MMAVSSVAFYVALIVYTRIQGLRSFSKLSGYDFAITVAFGSLLASVIVAKDPPLLQGVLALGFLFLIQFLVGKLRTRSAAVRHLMNNEPLLLMAGPDILHKNLETGQVTEADLKAKLREANVLNFSQIRAVVLETTGEISVLHAADSTMLDRDLLQGVRGLEDLR